MLNVIDQSDIMQYIDSLEDGHIKELLNEMHFDYNEYSKIGSVQEVRYYKTLCETKPIEFVNFLKNTVGWFDKPEKDIPKPKKHKGRPIKRPNVPEVLSCCYPEYIDKCQDKYEKYIDQLEAKLYEYEKEKRRKRNVCKNGFPI